MARSILSKPLEKPRATPAPQVRRCAGHAEVFSTFDGHQVHGPALGMEAVAGRRQALPDVVCECLRRCLAVWSAAGARARIRRLAVIAWEVPLPDRKLLRRRSITAGDPNV